MIQCYRKTKSCCDSCAKGQHCEATPDCGCNCGGSAANNGGSGGGRYAMPSINIHIGSGNSSRYTSDSRYAPQTTDYRSTTAMTRDNDDLYVSRQDGVPAPAPVIAPGRDGTPVVQTPVVPAPLPVIASPQAAAAQSSTGTTARPTTVRPQRRYYKEFP